MRSRLSRMARKPREKKVTIQVRVTPDQHRKIEIMCERLHLSKSLYVRRLLDEALQEVQIVERTEYDVPIPGL